MQNNTLLFHYKLKRLDNDKKNTYKLNFIDTFRFASSKLSELVDNLSEIYNKMQMV